MNYKHCLLAGLTVVSVLVVFSLHPIAQPEVFHRFADGRVFLGVANGANVLSNILLLGFGGVGLVMVWSLGSDADDDRIYVVAVDCRGGVCESETGGGVAGSAGCGWRGECIVMAFY